MSNEQEQIDRERYNAEAEEAYRAEVEEDTPRMAERTDRQAQIDPWKDVDWTALKDRAGTLGVHAAINYVQAQVDAARAADAARHQQELQVVEMGYAGMKAAQDLASNVIADLRAAISTVDAQVHQQAELLAQRWDTIERLTKQHNEWKAQAEQHAALLRERDAQIASLSEFRDAVASALCVENPFGEINNAAIVEAADITLSQLFEFSAEMTTLRAERDAAQQEAEATVIAQVLAHWFTQGGEARFGSLSMPCTIGNLKATREPANADELVSQILAALSSPPRPQEPQPAEPKSSETRKPVVNLMEALKKSLDSLNANRTSQEPGGHQP